MIRKVITTLVTAAVLLLSTVSAASADHVHSKEVGKPGSGKCVLLRNHNHNGVHTHVHKGVPGTKGNFRIGVYGTASDPCLHTGNYVNG